MKATSLIIALCLVISACGSSPEQIEPTLVATQTPTVALTETPTHTLVPTQTEAPTSISEVGTITGRTIDAMGGPFPEMPVMLKDLTAFSTTSGPDGYYTLREVPIGYHTIIAKSAGRGSNLLEVFVRENDITIQDLEVFVFHEQPTPNNNPAAQPGLMAPSSRSGN